MRDDQRASAATIESTLTDTAFDQQVEMVLSHLDDGLYRAAAVDGSVTFRRRSLVDADGVGRWSYETVETAGRNPLAEDATDTLLGHAAERDAVFPGRAVNSYPHAQDSIAQLFDAPHAPEMIAVHTASHHFDDHLGQHGSPGVVQARAPFIAAGAGIVAADGDGQRGFVDRSLRMVDVAPTIAAVLGMPVVGGVGPDGGHRPDARLARQDGDPADVLDGEVARHVVVFLLDGCNANLLYDAIGSGEAPHLAGLVSRGVAYRRGLFASMPTATLANHTTAVTGAHPGHSGVLHNAWYDRDRDVTTDLLSMDQIHSAMIHLDPDVETLHTAIHRWRPDAFTTAGFEFADTGADFSSFAEIRVGDVPPFPDLGDVAHLSGPQAGASKQYRFMSMVDHTSAQQTIRAWQRLDGNPLPTLSWVSLALTDEAGHESGPHGEAARASIRDSDGRVGDVLAAVEAAGALPDTAVFVIADHGMEQNDPDNDIRWDDALAATGVTHRQVAESFVYLP